MQVIRQGTKLLAIITLGLPLILTSTSAEAKLIFSSDFEKGSWKDDGWKRMERNGNDCRVVSSRARTGRHSMMFNHKTSKKERCEINTGGLPKNSQAWYGFSTYTPDDWQNDPLGAIVTQWHTHPDKGEEWRSPPMAMRYIDGNVWLTQIADSKKITRQGKAPISRKHKLGPIAKGKWSDWVVYYRWRYQGNDGLVEVWRRIEGEKDYQKVLTQQGPNIYNDPKGPYLKMGIYRSKYKRSKAKEQTIYHDAVKIGDRNSSFQEVAPQGTSSEEVNRRSNLAFNRPTKVSSEPQKEHRGRNAVDGKVNTRWSAKGYPQTLEVRLANPAQIGRIEILPYQERAYQFKIINDQGKVIADLSRNTKGGRVIEASFEPTRTSSIQLVFTGCHGSGCSKRDWVSISEVRIIGQ